jgi:hypothetical protein
MGWFHGSNEKEIVERDNGKRDERLLSMTGCNRHAERPELLPCHPITSYVQETITNVVGWRCDQITLQNKPTKQ